MPVTFVSKKDCVEDVKKGITYSLLAIFLSTAVKYCAILFKTKYYDMHNNMQ